MDISVLTTPNKIQLYKLAMGLAVFTIVYNITEGLISGYLGFNDESLALFGFGADSFIEAVSGFGIVHMILRKRHKSDSQPDNFEKNALKTTGISFYILVAGLVITSIFNIVTGQRPESTFWGIVVSIISIIIMLALMMGKIKTGQQLHSPAILADAECTRVCIYMSVILLISSGIFQLTGIAYIDSIGTLGLSWFAFKEGKECFEKANNNNDSCC
jgi:divalent metal cation (Fe/Co/Zn/Cd) transporter